MSFIFFGSDEFSVKVLETLAAGQRSPVLVVTAPDRPQGRHLVLTPPPAKVWATTQRIKICQPASLKCLKPDSPILTEGPKADFFLVASYGKIIPESILILPTKGTLNIHPSLLPAYRGPSPLETAILDGATETGVTIIKLDAEMDHGPILAQEKITLGVVDDFPILRDRLAVLGAELLLKILPKYLSGKLTPQEQNHAVATYTRKFTKTDGRLDPLAPAQENYRKILAFNPWPGAYLEAGDERIVIKNARLEEDHLIYDRVIPAGGREMSWEDYLRGRGSTKTE